MIQASDGRSRPASLLDSKVSLLEHAARNMADAVKAVFEKKVQCVLAADALRRSEAAEAANADRLQGVLDEEERMRAYPREPMGPPSLPKAPIQYPREPMGPPSLPPPLREVDGSRFLYPADVAAPSAPHEVDGAAAVEMKQPAYRQGRRRRRGGRRHQAARLKEASMNAPHAREFSVALAAESLACSYLQQMGEGNCCRIVPG